MLSEVFIRNFFTNLDKHLKKKRHIKETVYKLFSHQVVSNVKLGWLSKDIFVLVKLKPTDVWNYNTSPGKPILNIYRALTYQYGRPLNGTYLQKWGYIKCMCTYVYTYFFFCSMNC